MRCGLTTQGRTSGSGDFAPDRPELAALDGKALRRSHDRGLDSPALHLVSAFATTASTRRPGQAWSASPRATKATAASNSATSP